MKYLVFLLLSFFIAGCEQKQSNEKVVTKIRKKIKPNLSNPITDYNIEKHLENYSNLKNDITKDKKYYKSQNDINRVKQVTYTLLKDSIFPYWYGTTWDFNGFTETPLSGNIACGYFVTTTLRDVGFPIQRMYLARQPSSVLIENICKDSSIKKFNSVEDVKAYLKTYSENSLFILGLDSHVGFVSKETDNIFYIHSSYSGQKMVSKELLDKSIPVNSSKSFVIGNVLDNDNLLNQWMNN